MEENVTTFTLARFHYIDHTNIQLSISDFRLGKKNIYELREMTALFFKGSVVVCLGDRERIVWCIMGSLW